MMTRLQKWLKLASAQEKKELTARLGVTYPYVWQLAQPKDTPHSRTPNAETIVSIEKFTGALHKKSQGRLPKVNREDLHPMCAACPYAPCKKRG
jgi:hypothetical protein